MPTSVAVVVPTIGRPAINALLESLQAGTVQPLVVAVGNQSGRPLGIGNTERFAFDVVVVHSTGGISRARNDALNAISQYAFDIATFPNDDSFYETVSLERLAGAYEEYGYPDALAGTLREGGVARYTMPTRGTRLDRKTSWLAIEPATAISRTALCRFGHFDEDLGTGCATYWQSGEGTDLLLRVLARREEIVSVPDFTVVGRGEVRELTDADYLRKARSYARGMGRVYSIHDYGLPAMARALVGPWARQVLAADWTWDRTQLSVVKSVGRLEGMRGSTIDAVGLGRPVRGLPPPESRRPLRYVLLASHVPAAGGGGIVRYTIELARALNDDEGVELVVVTTTASFHRFSFLSPMEIVAVPAWIARLAPIADAVLSAAWLENNVGVVDVVHGVKHMLPRGRLSVGRYVLTVHDMLLFDRPLDFGALKRALLRFPYRSAVRRAHKLICVSRATSRRLVDYYPRVTDKAIVVPLAASVAEPELTSRLRFLADASFALVVGDWSSRKNLGWLLALWDDLGAEGELVMVGPTGWRGRNPAIGRSGVTHLGHVTDAELAWLYSRTKVVVSPSLVEGFGLPVAEAHAYGARVMVGDDPALGELVSAGGWTIPIVDSAGWRKQLRSTLRLARQDGLGGPRRGWADVAREGLAEPRDLESGTGDSDVVAQRCSGDPFRARLDVVHYCLPRDLPEVRARAAAETRGGWSAVAVAYPARILEDSAGSHVVYHFVPSKRHLVRSDVTIINLVEREVRLWSFLRALAVRRHVNLLVLDRASRPVDWLVEFGLLPTARLSARSFVDAETRFSELSALVMRSRAFNSRDAAERA